MGHAPSGDFLQDPQRQRMLRGRAGGIGGTEGVSVIGGAVKGGDILSGHQILRQNPAAAILQRHPLRAQRGYTLQQDLPGFPIFQAFFHTFPPYPEPSGRQKSGLPHPEGQSA